jgi:ribosomal protein S18 acetylase RimI-like enzyme
MAFDPTIALRIRLNARLRTAQGWGDFHDIGGALVVTSDAPIAGLNCIGDFTADDHRAEYLLDVGFALLRAFDRNPAVELTPLDRPQSLADRLEKRHMRRNGGSVTMLHTGRWGIAEPNREVDVWTMSPDDARTFADIHAGNERWVRRLSLKSTLGAVLDEGNTFYIAHVDGQPAGVLHLLCDESHTAGIYAVGTLRAFRRRGIATTLLLRAIADAHAAGCDVIALSTDLTNEAQRLYASVGFEPLFESQSWVADA